ncbi:hypothetical protein [Nonomuraea jabiensis]|uniref:hypothetical protein n=1 Tax=Nonomuraea jabiensis TaxID=882448 RepID=UPI003D720B65
MSPDNQHYDYRTARHVMSTPPRKIADSGSSAVRRHPPRNDVMRSWYGAANFTT